MRISEGVPNGRIAELYNPEMFQEREEVILFNRKDFNHLYSSMREQIDFINKTDLHLDRSEEWKLIGYWPKILQRVCMLDMYMNLIFEKKTVQSYLDAYLYNTIPSYQKDVTVSKNEGISTIKAFNFNLL